MLMGSVGTVKCSTESGHDGDIQDSGKPAGYLENILFEKFKGKNGCPSCFQDSRGLSLKISLAILFDQNG